MADTPDPDAPLPPPASFSDVEEQVARALVAAHRRRLGWLLRIPDWAGLYDQGVAALQLPGRRQGIRLEAALEALPLEHKHQLVRWVTAHVHRHLSRELAQQMCRVVGLERFSEVELDSVLTLRQWGRLREAMTFRLAREHARYKHAQQLLFVAHHGVVERVVARVVFSDTHRADCAQEGRVALLHAIDRVEVDGDFEAYAAAWVRRAVRNHLVRQRLPVHAPVNLIVQAVAESGATDHRPDARDGGGAGRERLASLILEMLRHPSVSLDDTREDDGAPLADSLADPACEVPDAAADRSDLRGWVARGLDTLTDKQRDVVAQRFGLSGVGTRTLTEIARAAGISHQQVCMRERRALQRLERMLAPVVAEYDASENP